MNIFVYGTLKRGFANNYILADANYLGEGSVGGYCLYHVSWYPAMVESGSEQDVAYGEVYDVENEDIVKELDEIEEEGRLYKKIQVNVKLENGKNIEAYAYVWIDKLNKDVLRVENNNWIGNGGKKILITGTVANASEESKQLYRTIIEICGRYSTAISSPLDTMNFKGTNEERYRRAMELLQDTKFIIAEMSVASTGQGMELQEAVRLNIPIIIVAKENSKISGLILGTEKVIEVIYYKNIKELEEKLKESLRMTLRLYNFPNLN